MTKVHCRTCGQDLPEPQARLEFERLQIVEAEAERQRVMREADTAAIERENRQIHLAFIKDLIRMRKGTIEPDDIWALRDEDLARANRKRLAQFHRRAKLYGKTIEMTRVPASAPSTFHHQV